MVANVYGQLERSREDFLAVWTLVQVFRGVTLTVNLQVGALREALTADVALVRFLPRVHANVLDEVGFLAEGLGALRAFERSGSRVRFDVAGQETKTTEAFAAVRALERSFSGVCAHVILQLAFVTKLLLTQIARVSLLARVLVRLSLGRQRDHLSAGRCLSRGAFSVYDGLYRWRSFNNNRNEGRFLGNNVYVRGRGYD